jgi:hypothetical protein
MQERLGWLGQFYPSSAGYFNQSKRLNSDRKVGQNLVENHDFYPIARRALPFAIETPPYTNAPRRPNQAISNWMNSHKLATIAGPVGCDRQVMIGSMGFSASC